MTRLMSLAILAAAALAVAASAADAASTTVLRLNGIGPLTLGMTRTAAVATGWLGDRTTGCPLGAPPLPITYRFTGTEAPAGIKGSAEFHNGRLRSVTFTHGVRTSTGVTVRKTTTARMLARYRDAGFTATAKYVSTFQGTFVTVKKAGHEVVGGFAEHRTVTILAIPAVPVCE
jgi:hypothetical protein